MVARNALNIGEVWNTVCCHGNKTVKLALWSRFSRNQTFLIQIGLDVFFIMFDQNLVEFMMPSLGTKRGTKRDI